MIRHAYSIFVRVVVSGVFQWIQNTPTVKNLYLNPSLSLKYQIAYQQKVDCVLSAALQADVPELWVILNLPH